MKTIAIDARIISSSTGRYVMRLIQHLEQVDNEHRYIILVRQKDENYFKPSNPNFTVQIAEFDNYSFGEQRGFLALLNSLHADLVHFCMPQQPLGYQGTHVTTVHDLTLLNTYNSDKNWLVYHAKQIVGRYVFRTIGKTSANIITPSEYTKNQYVKFAGIAPDKVTVTYESADRFKFEPLPYSELVNARFLLYVGQQSDYKNIKRLIQAHQQLRERHSDLLLVLVGSLNESAKRNKDWVEKQGYSGVMFTGFVDDATLGWLYLHCAADVFPSLMEGFGLPGLEAMAYGAPVASSNATCLPEIYGDAALYFDPLSVDDIAAVTERLITNPELREEQIQKGNAQLEKYSWKRMAEQTLAVYKKALGE